MVEEKSGKTTLIKSIFWQEVAKANVEDPDEIYDYEINNNVYNFSDTPIVDDDLISQTKLHEKILKRIDERINTKVLNSIVHCVWHCFKCGSGIISKSRIQFITKLHEELAKYKIPIIFVLT